MISIEKKDLIELLTQAFDKGWQGYLDLREEVVDGLVEKFLKNHTEEKQCIFEWVGDQGPNSPVHRSASSLSEEIGTGLQGAQGVPGMRYPNSYWISTTSDITLT